MILNKKGGYCFENNKLFFYLLKNLGFKVHPFLGKVVYNKDLDTSRTHRATLVEVNNQEYLVDVGFGPYTPNIPVPLDGRKVIGCDIPYFISENENVFELNTIRNESNFIFYTFDKAKYTEADFQVANYFSCTHKSAKFVNELVISRKSEQKLEFIANNRYTSIKNGSRTNIDINSIKDFNSLLKNFYIDEEFSRL